MAQVTESEYRAKEREKDRYEHDKTTCEKKIGSLNDQISALDRAISQMTDVYGEFKRKVKEIDTVLNEEREFTGNQQSRLIKQDGGTLYNNAVYCRDKVVNHALDEMEWLRNDLRAKRNEQYGILGRIQNHISSIGTWLKTNFFNN